MLNNNLDFRYFIGSFAIGMLFVYMYQPKKEIVYKFPNPNNVDKVVYKDKDDACYKFKYEKNIFSNLDEICEKYFADKCNLRVLNNFAQWEYS